MSMIKRFLEDAAGNIQKDHPEMDPEEIMIKIMEGEIEYGKTDEELCLH